jgi:hypothetical protein
MSALDPELTLRNYRFQGGTNRAAVTVHANCGLNAGGPIRYHDRRMDTIILYRPVGPAELRLICESGWKEFPPGLPEQPIFYPVTNERYAAQIARDWNVKDSGAGLVTRFAVRADYMAKFATQKVGGAEHTEYWVPAEELTTFNENIVGLIEVTQEFSSLNSYAP